MTDCFIEQLTPHEQFKPIHKALKEVASDISEALCHHITPWLDSSNSLYLQCEKTFQCTLITHRNVIAAPLTYIYTAHQELICPCGEEVGKLFPQKEVEQWDSML